MGFFGCSSACRCQLAISSKDQGPAWLVKAKYRSHGILDLACASTGLTPRISAGAKAVCCMLHKHDQRDLDVTSDRSRAAMLTDYALPRRCWRNHSTASPDAVAKCGGS